MVVIPIFFFYSYSRIVSVSIYEYEMNEGWRKKLGWLGQPKRCMISGLVPPFEELTRPSLTSYFKENNKTVQNYWKKEKEMKILALRWPTVITSLKKQAVLMEWITMLSPLYWPCFFIIIIQTVELNYPSFNNHIKRRRPWP